MTHSLHDAAQQLSSLPPGESMWFWFCPGARPALVLSRMKSDPGMVSFREAYQSAGAPRGRVPMIGFVTSEVGGGFSFGSPRASERLLRALARWVRKNIAQTPALGVLVGATAFRFNADMEITDRIEDASLWDGLQAPAPVGSPEATAAAVAALQAAPEQAKAWFWLGAAGPGGAPALCMMPQADDPSGARFQQLVSSLARKAPGRLSVSGVATCLRNERLVLVASRASGTEGWQDHLQAFTEANVARLAGLAPLRSARMITMEGGEPVIVPIRPAELAEDLSVVAQLSQGEVGWFCLTADRDGPRLLLSTERERLRERAQGHARPTVRGQVAIRRGRVCFRVRKPAPSLGRDVSAWVQRHRERWPALSVLDNPAVSVRT